MKRFVQQLDHLRWQVHQAAGQRVTIELPEMEAIRGQRVVEWTALWESYCAASAIGNPVEIGTRHAHRHWTRSV